VKLGQVACNWHLLIREIRASLECDLGCILQPTYRLTRRQLGEPEILVGHPGAERKLVGALGIIVQRLGVINDDLGA